MRNILKLQFILIAFLSLTIVSCNDWLDVNEDPNNTDKGRVELLLPSAQAQLFTYFTGYDSDASIGNILGTVMHQIVGAGNHYNVTPTLHTLNESFTSMYSGGLKDLEEVIRIGTENGDMKYVGIAKILKAYTFSLYVDIWGDVPFSEALIMPKVFYPHYEAGDEIYPKLFDILDEGIENIKNATSKTQTQINTNDLIYGGSTSKWIKFANTAKLNMYNKIRLHSSFDATALASLIAENNFIDEASAFEMEYHNKKSPQNRNPMYVDEYGDNKDTYYFISHWFYGAMKGKNYIPFLEGIVDPRIPYYFYSQNKPGASKVDYNEGDFYTKRFGSHSKDMSSNFKNYTCLGLYPCGGKYDMGEHKPGDDKVDTLRGSGIAPARLFSYHDLLYVKAELALEGEISADAKELLKEAMEASFEKVNDIVALDDNGKKFKLANINRDEYINTILAKYEAADKGGKLEIIITEKWIAGFANPVVSYNDYRRTGYPKLFNPDTDDSDADTYLSRSFPVSMPYANSSITANKNAPKQRTISSDKVFWDIDLKK